MTDVYQKYMHRIAIAITTLLQDQGKGLIMLPMNPLPILFPPASLFFFPRRSWQYSPAQPAIPQQRSASSDRLIISSIPSKDLWNISTIRQNQEPHAEKGSSLQISPISRWGFIFPSRVPKQNFSYA